MGVTYPPGRSPEELARKLSAMMKRTQDMTPAMKVGADIEAAARAVVAPGERVRFITVAGVVCDAVVLGIDWVDGIELRVQKPSGMTFRTFADEGTEPGTFQRG